MKSFIPFSEPCIGKPEIEEVVKTLKSGWITTGTRTIEFEKRIEKYLGCKYAIPLSSCTAALHLALIANGISDGHEVITTPYTFASTGETILYQRAKPVFVDIEPETMNIDAEQIEKAVTPKTRAIMPVHFAGHPCEMDKIWEIANKFNLKVIEDAAHAFGAWYHDRNIGTIGDATCFSFYATKNLTTGEGGMLTTNDKELSEHVRLLSLHGLSKGAWARYSTTGLPEYDILMPGYKYNMTDIQAAIGIHQLAKFDEMQQARSEIVQMYYEAFSECPWAIFQIVQKKVIPAWHLYPLRIDFKSIGQSKAKFFEKLRSAGIGFSVHFRPLHLHSYYQRLGFREGDFPNAEKAYDQEVSLPLYPTLSPEKVARIIQDIKSAVKG